ncbi:hypothetical protein ACS0TY_032847 [Phlomoides rotata]
MDNPTHQTRSKRPPKERKICNPLKYTFDGQCQPKTPPDDDTTESNSDSDRHSATSVAASFQLLANSMLRMELAELEMMKSRETARLEAQRRQSELEYELTRMMLQTQSHIASFVSQNSSSRKRKSPCVDDGSKL